jgi:hypothetical protein
LGQAYSWDVCGDALLNALQKIVSQPDDLRSQSSLQ